MLLDYLEFVAVFINFVIIRNDGVNTTQLSVGGATSGKHSTVFHF